MGARGGGGVLPQNITNIIQAISIFKVVEAFFLNDKEQYLELEFGPHGQHLMLLLNGNRNAIK